VDLKDPMVNLKKGWIRDERIACLIISSITRLIKVSFDMRNEYFVRIIVPF
jgi:hypothetical protein